MKDRGRWAAAGIHIESQPSVHDLQEELARARREDLEPRLPCDLREEAGVLARERHEHGGRELITAHVAVEHLWIECDLLRCHRLAFDPFGTLIDPVLMQYQCGGLVGPSRLEGD